MDCFRADHRRLGELLDAARTSIVAVPHGKDRQTAGLAAGAVERLRDYRQELAAHFRQEEEGGCLEEAVSRVPAVSADVDAIADEHKRLLRRLDDFIDKFAAGKHPQSPAGARERFNIFAAQVALHEAAENRVIARAFGVDLAGECCECCDKSG